MSTMIMLDSTRYWRLKLFKAFWVLELEKDRADRFTPMRFRENIFTQHARNMRRASIYMSHKKDKKKPKFVWKGYANVGVTEAVVPDLEKFVSDEKRVFSEYNKMLVTNYQIKLYFDDYSESIKCVAVCHQHDDPNFGYALSSFAEDWYTALAVMIFKHIVICEHDWDNASSKTLRKFG